MTVLNKHKVNCYTLDLEYCNSPGNALSVIALLTLKRRVGAPIGFTEYFCSQVSEILTSKPFSPTN